MRVSLVPLLAVAILAPAALAQTQTSDLKVETQFTANRQPPFTTTQYIKGARSRIERDFAGHPRVTINQCDLHQVLQLDPEARRYTSYQLDKKGFPVGTRAPLNEQRSESSGGTLVVNVETTDTGERKDFFGRTARHIVEKQTMTPGPGAISQGQERVRDGWFIDLEVNAGCGTGRPPLGAVGVLYAESLGGPIRTDKIEVHRKGVPVTGFAVSLTTKTTSLQANPRRLTFESLREVVELSSAPLDPALFEVPSSYKKVDRLPDYIVPGPPAHREPPETTWGALKRYWASLFH